MSMVRVGALLMLLQAWVQAQPHGTITGVVREAGTNRPLAAVNVILEGTRQGMATDADGRFQLLLVPPGPHRLRCSLVGYAGWSREMVMEPGAADTISVDLTPVIIPGFPVTVTATRGSERETPGTFSNLERSRIREHYTVQDIPVLLSELPSSTYYSESGNGIGYTYLNIRGFDARRVAVMVNGIPQNDPEDHNVYWLDFPDLAGSLEDAQVQRGAGSAFYGPPAIGGSVNLLTTRIDRARSLELSAGAGSFGTRRYSAAFTSGLIGERYAFHARLSKIRSDGYRERSWTDFGSYFFGAARMDESMTTQINLYGGPVADHLAYYGIPKSDVTDREKRRANPIARNEEIENFSQPHYELFHEWRISPWITLNNTLFLVNGEGFFDYDGSWAPLSYYRITRSYGFDVTGDPDTVYLPGALIRAWVSNRQYGWLPRLTVRHANGRLIAGAEVRFHRSEHWGRLGWASLIPAGVPADYRYYAYRGGKDMLSLYANEDYQPSPDLTLQLSVQYAFNTYRLYDERFIGTDFAVPYHFVNPRAGINVNLSPAWNVSCSVAYTSREPRLKNLYDAAEASTPASWGAIVPQFGTRPGGGYDFSDPLVKPESLFDLELGTGVTGVAGKAGLNLYWMEFSDEIVKSGRVDRFGQPVTGNAARTRHTGVELHGTVTPCGGLEVNGTMTLSRNRFVRHTDYSGGGAVSLDGNPIAGFPDVLAGLRLTYSAGPLSFSWNSRYVGKQYTGNFKEESSTVDPAFLQNASLSWALDGLIGDTHLLARIQVNNVFDVLYAAYGEGNQFFVGPERNAFFNLALTME
jgi:iron complex outermembrane receptor protein